MLSQRWYDLYVGQTVNRYVWSLLLILTDCRLWALSILPYVFFAFTSWLTGLSELSHYFVMGVVSRMTSLHGFSVEMGRVPECWVAQKPASYSLSGGFCWSLSPSDKGNVMLYVHIGHTITFTHSITSGGAFVIDCPHLSGWGAIAPSAPPSAAYVLRIKKPKFMQNFQILCRILEHVNSAKHWIAVASKPVTIDNMDHSRWTFS